MWRHWKSTILPKEFRNFLKFLKLRHHRYFPVTYAICYDAYGPDYNSSDFSKNHEKLIARLSMARDIRMPRRHTVNTYFTG